MAQTRTKIALSESHPELAAQWHPTKNGELTPEKVTAGSGKKAWWICSEGLDYEWEASSGSRTARGVGCPYCTNLRVSATNSLATLYPEAAAQWHPTIPETLLGESDSTSA